MHGCRLYDQPFLTTALEFKAGYIPVGSMIHVTNDYVGLFL